MTESLLPRELADLPHPWNLTSDRARRAVLANWTADPRTTQDALLALERSLLALPDLPEPPDDALPADLMEYFDFTADWLAESMPELDDLSTTTIAKLLSERTGSPAPETEVRSLARHWLRYVTVGITQAASRWLSHALELLHDLPEVDRFLAIAERELPRQPIDLASGLLSDIARQGHGQSDSLLARVVTDERADPELRRHARSLRVWLGTIPPERPE